MHWLIQGATYTFLFITLYLEVFLVLTYLENSEKRQHKKRAPRSTKLPSVSIMVPCWNEASTLSATIYSILQLRYPPEKLKVLIIDDGSTDRTWQIMQSFKDNPRVTLLRKKNGGKHTALNYGLQFVDTELVGCLDADSFVDREALLRIATEFTNETLMAVTPSIKIHRPKTILELIQKVEYGWGILLRHLMASLGAVYITPGPFSIFRKEVFDKLGGYRKAHNTEDMEIAIRMQKAGMKIGNAFDAFVYTKAPRTLRTLLKQRLRWTYGFLMNARDHKDLYFNPRYGNLGMLILPAATLSIFSTVVLFLSGIYGRIVAGVDIFQELSAVDWNVQWSWNFDPFYVNTTMVTLISLLALGGTVFLLFASRKMTEGHRRMGVDVLYFLCFYGFLAPFWMGHALYNAALHKGTTWR